MAYRRPAVTVIQEFIGLVPALAVFNLPSVVVGPAYQIVDNDSLGSYDGLVAAYSYASLMGGAQVDLEELVVGELYPATKKPISAYIKNAKVQILTAVNLGSGNTTTFADLTALQFQNVLSGDLLKVKETLGVSVLSAQTNGQSVATVGLRDRLTAGVPGQFANAKVGDTITVTAGTNTNVGVYTVAIKISNDVLKLNADINNGVGASSNIAYSIIGNRGTLNQGLYKVKVKTDNNNLVLESPLAESETLISYDILRNIPQINLDRLQAIGNGFFPEAAALTLGAGITFDIGINTYPVVEGITFASYRALRNDLTNIRDYAKINDVEAVFGIGQIVPANPLAYGLSIMLQNTTTPVNSIGLDENAVINETLSYQGALDSLELTDMYALVPLTQNAVIHQLFKTHVEALSQPGKKKERVVVINRKLLLVETLVDSSTTVETLTGSRTIVPTQADGAGALALPGTVNDATVDQFFNVKPGDLLVVVGGTNATLGTYPILTVPTVNQVTVTGSIFTGTSTDLQYYIVRPDGISFNGLSFYDRNATFLSSSVVAGNFLKVTAGTFVGRYKIATVVSEKEVTLALAINGVTTAIHPVTYLVDRDMTKTEQATFIKGYSSAFASRRVVNLWSDILETPVGQVVEDLPGFFGACAIGAITTGLPTQQGFTNLSISGFLGLKHSSGYFNDTQLDIIADGGTMILAQDVPEAPLFIRHQLTTDRSSIKFQEFSVTKNVDFIAKFLRDTYKGFPGRYNIIDTTLDELRTVAKAVLTFLKEDTRLPRIGGVIRSGSLVKVEESTTQIDTVKMRFKFDIPIPLNNLDITIEV